MKSIQRRVPWLLPSLFSVVLVFFLLWISGSTDFSNLDRPIRLSGDILSELVHSKSLREDGLSIPISRLSAPFTFDNYDFRGQDGLFILIRWLIARLVESSFSALNIFHLISACLAAFLMTALALPTFIGSLFATLFALLPYYFSRGVSHLNLAAYFMVPLTFWLIENGPRFSRVSLFFFGILLGLSGTYYSIYSAGLLLLAAAMNSNLRRLIWTLSGLGVAIVAQHLPGVWYRSLSGQNFSVAKRTVTEVEQHSLGLLGMFGNFREHRFEFLRAFPFWTSADLGFHGEILWGVGIGSIAVIGLLGLLLEQRREFQLKRRISILSLLFAVSGGLGSLFGIFGFPLRAHSRLVPYFAFLGLSYLATRFSRASRYAPILAPALALLICLYGLFEQLPKQTQAAMPIAEFRELESGFRLFEDWIQRNSPHLNPKVFQIPVMGYPEVPPRQKEGQYASAIPYLFTDSIHFSGHLMRSRIPLLWQELLIQGQVPPPTDLTWVNRIAQFGFDAILLDRFAVSEPEQAKLEGALRRIAGPEPFVFAQGRYSGWLLPSSQKNARPILGSQWEGDITQLPSENKVLIHRGQGSLFFLVPPAAEPVDANLTFSIAFALASERESKQKWKYFFRGTPEVKVHLSPSIETLHFDRAGEEWRYRLRFPPGPHRIQFRFNRQHRDFEVKGLRIES